MRLIDADAMLKKINSEENQRADSLMREWYATMVENTPTAYDVDKVLEQLKNNADYSTGEDGTVIDEYVYLTKAIKIVKSGGID